MLEPRTLMAVLPPITPGSQVNISGSIFGNDVAPTIVIDPTNPSKMVAVWTHDDPAHPIAGQVTASVEAAYSTQGGAANSWISLGGLPGAIVDFGHRQDQGTVYFGQVTDGSVAFGRNDQVYILTSPHAADYSSGEILLQKFDFSGGAPTLVPIAGPSNGLAYQWTNDAAFKPTLAVDDNLSSFTSTDSLGTPHNQSDPHVGEVYIAWGANNNTSGVGGNPNVIDMVASSDGGRTFTEPVIANASGNFGNERDSTPKLVISQGRPSNPTVYGAGDPGVPGGQVTAIWDDSLNNRIVSTRVNNAGSGQEFAGSTSGMTSIQLTPTTTTPPVASGASIGDAVDPGNNAPHEPAVTTFPLVVSGLSGPVNNLTATVSLVHPNLSEVKIELISPAGTVFTLLNNALDAGGNGTGVGTGGANLGIANSGQGIGTTFDSNAVRSIRNTGGGNSNVGHVQPEGGTLSSLLAPGDAALDGTWTLRITDFRHDNNPNQFLVNWKLDFSSGLTPQGDITVVSGVQAGSTNNGAYPVSSPATPVQGIGPGAEIASDNTLGAFSPFQGRLYVAYVSGNKVLVKFSDNAGVGWISGGATNHDNPKADGYTGGGRPQFMPAIAVDQSTGTVVVSSFDARDDAAQARVATYVTTSIDGGQSFATESYVNTPQTATDYITGKTVVLGPIPDNESAGAVGSSGFDPAFGYGDHQGLAVAGGHVYATWASNLNGSRTENIATTQAVIAAGPRIVASTQGPVGLTDSQGNVIDTVNFHQAPDGTPEASDFQVTFDRPIDPSTFSIADVKIFFQPANGGAQVPISAIGVTPLSSAGDPNNDGYFGFESFDVSFAPQSGVGTYSYEVGPNISDRIPSVVTSQATTQTVSQAAAGLPIRVPQSGTGGTGTAADTVTSSITLTGHPNQTIQDLRVNLDIQHPRDGDLTITLTAPNGKTILLYSNPSDTGQNFGNGTFSTTFDDNAGVSINDPLQAFAPYFGLFRPAGADTGNGLSILDNSALDGTYTLTITDNTPVNFGSLLSWSISADTVVPGSTFQLGNAMDQDANAVNGEASGDVFAVPTPMGVSASATPSTSQFFGGPYSQDTLPLIVSGPHQINAFPHATGTAASAGFGQSLVQNATVDGIVVIFDRDMVTPAAPGSVVTRVMGPAGLIPGPYTFTADPAADPAHPFRAFLIGFPNAQTPGYPKGVVALSGTYTASYGPGFTDFHGNALDQNLNAGVYVLDPSRNPNRQTTQATYQAPQPSGGTAIPDATASATSGAPATPGVLISTLTVPDNFTVRGLTVQLNISHPNDPDLEVTLVAPDGTPIKLFTRTGAAGSHADFGGRNPLTGALLADTIFNDLAPTSIDSGGPPFFGSFRPEQSLTTALISRQAGAINSGGTWKLIVQDDTPGNVGTLNDWSLTFTKDVPVSGLGEPVIDQATANFRIFTMDPTNPLSSNTWTSSGPASLGGGGGNSTGPEGGGFKGGKSGRIGGLAVDPSDPSGNTVYVGGATGGIWKTTNFLTTAASGPTYVPLTDFGPTFATNIGGIAVFPRNNDPNQSIIFAVTGDGDGGAQGVGFLRSMDGGATWQLLDSTVNVDSSGNFLPIMNPTAPAPGTPTRDHAFVGTTAFKIVVDPKLSPTNDVIVYAAMSSGIWRSTDSGKTWGVADPTDPTGKRRIANLAGDATDVVLDPASGTGAPGGNLQIVYAAMRGQGVFLSPNRGQVWNLMTGTIGDPLIQSVRPPAPGPTAVPVTPGPTPNGSRGRIELAKPFLTGNAAQDRLYEGWLYAALQDGTLYLTKDYGQNWTKVRLPSAGGIPTNDTNQPDFVVTGGGKFPQGDYDLTLAIDPTNPNVVYMGGTANDNPSGFIRVDTTGISDPHAVVRFSSSNPDGGQTLANSTGPLSPAGLGGTSFLNFLPDTTTTIKNATRFNNQGSHTRWIPFDFAFTDDHRMVTMVDPLTGHARLILGSDGGVFSIVDNNGSFDSGIGTAGLPSGSRNGNLQINQFYYGAAQPSDLAAQIAGALFYGNAQDQGDTSSPSDLLTSGNITWDGPGGDAFGVQTDQTPQVDGGPHVYKYISPTDAGTDFFSVDGVGRTNGLLQVTTGANFSHDPQWPDLPGAQFQINPLTGQQGIISSFAGRIFASENLLQGNGVIWQVIGDPGALDGTYAPALAYGAPDPNATAGVGNFDNFLYAGTSGGHIFVTQSGGGAAGNQWKDISAGITGGGVQQIITNPTRTSHEAYAVTGSGVFHDVNSVQVPGGPAATTWTNITGNLFSVMHNSFGDPNQAETEARGLTTIQADWRYVIPNNPAVPNGPTHPILYVSGQGGVYRSLDDGQTWALFPDAGAGSLNNSPAGPGGGMPNVDVTQLSMVLGNVDPTTGRALAKMQVLDPTTGLMVTATGPNLLLATTYGQGSFSIRLAPLVFTNTATQPALLTLDPASDTGLSSSDAISKDPTPTIHGLSEQTAFGNTVTVNLLDLTPTTPGGPPVDPTTATIIGTATTDATGHFTVTVTTPFTMPGIKTIGIQAIDGSGTKGNVALLSYTFLNTPPATPNTPDLEAASDTGPINVPPYNTDNYTAATSPVFDISGFTPSTAASPIATQLIRKVHGAADSTYQVVGQVTNPLTGTTATFVSITDTGGGTTPVPVPDGVYDYASRQFDLAGNSSVTNSGPLTVTIDTLAPNKPSTPTLLATDDSGVKNDNKTNVTMPHLTGTLLPEAPALGMAPEPTATVQIVQVIGTTTTVLGSGAVGVGNTYSVQFATALPNGPITVQMRAVDLAGNVGPLSGPITLNIDTLVPAKPTIDINSADDTEVNSTGTVTGTDSIPGEEITRINRPRIVGTATPGLTITLFSPSDPTIQPVSMVVPSTGSYQVQFATPFADGIHTVQVQAADDAGNSRNSDPLTLQILTHGPKAAPTLALDPVDQYGAPGTTASRQPFFIGTADPGPNIYVDLIAPDGTVAATALVDGTGHFANVQISYNLNDGQTTLTPRSRDIAGNLGPAGTPLTLSVVSVLGDYNLQGKAGLATFRPPNATTSVLNANGTGELVNFGAPNLDIPVQGDFDGDGKTDVATFRPSDATWSLLQSQKGGQLVTLGSPGDIPVPGNYDGPGKTELATYNPNTAVWTILGGTTSVVTTITFGVPHLDVPAPADYLGNNRTDIAIFRPTTGEFFILNPTTGAITSKAVPGAGSSLSIPVPADYDGTGTADFATYQPSTANWTIVHHDGTVQLLTFGDPNVDVPIPRDYDGDGKVDIATYRPTTATFSLLRSSLGGELVTFGSPNVDLPTAGPSNSRNPSYAASGRSLSTSVQPPSPSAQAVASPAIVRAASLDFGAQAAALTTPAIAKSATRASSASTTDATPAPKRVAQAVEPPASSHASHRATGHLHDAALAGVTVHRHRHRPR